MTSSLLPHDPCAFYRPETKREPDNSTLSCVTTGMTKENHT